MKPSKFQIYFAKDCRLKVLCFDKKYLGNEMFGNKLGISTTKCQDKKNAYNKNYQSNYDTHFTLGKTTKNNCKAKRQRLYHKANKRQFFAKFSSVIKLLSLVS